MESDFPEFGRAEPGADYVLRPGGYAVVVGGGGRVAVVRVGAACYLPGGGQDAGESAEDAAARECREEAGLLVRVVTPLGTADELVRARSEGRHFRKRCCYVLAEPCGTAVSSEPDHELAWLTVREAAASLSLGADRWALARAAESGVLLPAIRAVASPPSDLGPLIEAALAQGFGAVRRLADEWASGTNRFDRAGEVLLEARLGGELVGICGLNVDPFAEGAAAGRVRRLYVLPAVRRRGVGRALVDEVVARARGPFAELRLRTGSAEADAFYRALGFEAVTGVPGCTHRRLFGGGTA